MPNEEVLDFQCPKCTKRLKAGAAFAGRRVKCPNCQQAVTVPGISLRTKSDKAVSPQPQPPTSPPNAATEPVQLKPVASLDDDWLNLGGPAIADVSTRQQEFEEKKAALERERISRINKQRERKLPIGAAADAHETVEHQRVAPKSEGQHDAEQDGDFVLAPLVPTEKKPAESSSPRKPKRSVFEDDLPDLAELDPSPRAASIENQLLATHAGIDPIDLPNLSALDVGHTTKQGLSGLPKLIDIQSADEEIVDKDPSYRILCAACGTAQYVRLSNKGRKIKCPDCYLEFKIPAPPPNWSPQKKKLKLTNEDMPLAAAEELHHPQTLESQRSRASQILEKAQQQVTDEDLERLYDGDFDTAGFLQRTFGFLKDPIAMAHIAGYAIIFAGLFAMGQFAANNREEGFFGRGVILLTVIGAPAMGLLFTMPLLSSGLALLESVANRQKKVAEWPGFNIFENAGDMMATTVALLAAMVPGFLVGMWLGGESEGAGRIQIAGMMVTTFLLFPVFLLSMLDNGSVFAPLSSAIFRSFSEAAESWAGYFLKTLIAFSGVMMLWLMLLGKNEVMAAIAGCLYPLLVFFTCQQLGALADGISEHLSFEFTTSSKDEGQIEDESATVLPGLKSERSKSPATKPLSE